MEAIRLVDDSVDGLGPGYVLRFPAKRPYEAFVDYMAVDLMIEGRGLSFIVSSGRKAGVCVVNLPIESEGDSGKRGICTKWLIENWEKWVYPECKAEDVYVIPRYPVPTLP